MMVMRIIFWTSTPAPSTNVTFSTGGNVSNARRGCGISIRPKNWVSREKYLLVSFPDFNLSIYPIAYFDSLLAIPEHQILGVDDIKEDPNLDFVQNAFIKAGGGFLQKCKIELQVLDAIGNSFVLSTVFGSQKDSYLKIKKVKKTTFNGSVFYDLVFDFRCSLYHWPQYGKQGLWGTVENGTFVTRIKAK
jgi:hypothetical protein